MQATERVTLKRKANIAQPNNFVMMFQKYES